MNRFANILLTLIAISMSCLAFSAEKLSQDKPTFTATFYKLDSNRKEKLYTQKMWSSSKGGKNSQKSVYSYADGRKAQVVDEEIIWDENGFDSYVVNHHQLQESWETTRVGKRVYFVLRNHKTGEIEKDDEELESNFVVGPMIISYLQKRWKKLVAGETLRVRFGVPARLETIGFKFEREKEVSLDGRRCLEVKMKPTNFIIALLVDPIRIYFDLDTQQLVRIKGRTIPRYKNGDNWDELDAEIDYFYGEN